jgi:hypothetical protein
MLNHVKKSQIFWIGTDLLLSPPVIKEKTPKVHLYTFGVLVKKYLSVKNKP